MRASPTHGCIPAGVEINHGINDHRINDHRKINIKLTVVNCIHDGEFAGL